MNNGKFDVSDYDELKLFFSILWEEWISKQFSFKVSDEANPVNCVEKAERKGKAYAFKGLKMAIQDCMEMTGDENIEELKRLDSVLKKQGAYSLSFVRSILFNEIFKILARGKIRSDIEYYLVKEKIENPTELSDKERESLMKMSDVYEFRKMGKRSDG